MELMGLIGVGVTLFISGFNAAIFCIIKFNDISHLQKDLAELKESVKCIDKKLYINAEEIGIIKGKCKANHG